MSDKQSVSGCDCLGEMGAAFVLSSSGNAG